MTANATPPMMIPAVSNPGPTSASGAALPENTTMAEITTPNDAFADDQTRREQHAQLLCRFGLGSAIGALIEEPTDNRADHDHQRALRRQINSEPDRQRRNTHVFRRARKDFVQQNDADADQCADSDQTPIDVRGDDALRERGDQARLRCRQWMGTQAPRPARRRNRRRDSPDRAPAE